MKPTPPFNSSGLRRKLISWPLFIAIFLYLILPRQLYAQLDLGQALRVIEGVSVKELDTTSNYPQRYLLWVDQPLDHKNASAGQFRQRVIVEVKDRQAPVVFVTEGYSAGYALSGKYRYELSDMLEASQVIVEHRFFKPSTPETDTFPWKYLTVENAAADHHRIITLLRPILGGKWISTGISKGGQATMFHRALYPGDVDASVGYVCPLNFSDEDLRVYEFLEKVGSVECREKVRTFQTLLLEHKEDLLPVFIKQARSEDLSYKRGWEAGFEILAMEYAFAFWQWGGIQCNDIPGEITSPEAIIAHLDTVSSLDWGAEQSVGTNPFFYQALTEIGMYGYDTTGFGHLLSALDDYSFRFACPNDIKCQFDGELMKKVDCYIRHEAERFLFIYGGNDPWSATAVQWSGNPGVRVYTLEGGSHRTRIHSFPEQQQDEITELLETWLSR